MAGGEAEISEEGKQILTQRAELIRAQGLFAVAAPWLSAVLSAATREANPALAGLLRAMFLANDADSYAAQCLALRDGAVTSGRVLLTGSVEVEHPLTDRVPALLGALFVDAGNAADRWDKMRPVVGYGTGVHYRSPVGPLRVDVAYGQHVHQVRLHVSVGITF